MRTRPTAIRAVAFAAALAAGALAHLSPVAGANPSNQVASTDARLAVSADQKQRPRLIPLPPPSRFVSRVSSRYLPWQPGTRWVYRGFGSEGDERDVVVVLERTKLIKGISATVVRDVVRRRGRVIERTFDWYAQDRRGRVWYLGENTHAYEHGEVSTEGSWKTGVDGARAGQVMFRKAHVGKPYWQEHYAGHAEDIGVLVDRSTKAAVMAGHFDHVRMTQDTTPLEPRVVEFKFYAPGVGVVLELDVSPEQGRVELVRMDKP